MQNDHALRVLRVRMWEYGHTFQEIDDISLEDFGDVVSYWRDMQRVEKYQRENKKAKANARAIG